jgi:hypothetical protein
VAHPSREGGGPDGGPDGDLCSMQRESVTGDQMVMAVA